MSLGTKLSAWSMKLGLDDERLLFFLLIQLTPPGGGGLRQVAV
jgi:hypothetical protein